MKRIFILTVMFFIFMPFVGVASDLGALLEMQERQNQRQLKAQEQLLENIGNIAEQRGRRAFERDALEFFGTEPITHEKISQFSSMYPNVPLAEIYRIAGEIQSLNRKMNYPAASYGVSKTARNEASFGEYDPERFKR